MACFQGDDNVVKLVMAAQFCVHLINTEFCSLEGWTSWYVDYSSVKLFLKYHNEIFKVEIIWTIFFDQCTIKLELIIRK